MENEDALICISESIPEPTVEWVFRDSQSERYDVYIEVTDDSYTYLVFF